MTSRADDLIMMRIVILGGTFDPIHNGHIAMAESAVRELAPDKMLIIPAGRPYFKGDITPYDVRCEMVRLAIDDMRARTKAGSDRDICIEISRLESAQDRPTYTYQTLRSLKDEYPDSEFFFCCGTDVFNSIHLWVNPEEVLKYATLAVFERSGYETCASVYRAGRDKLTSLYPDAACVMMNARIPDVSSTQIRERISRGEPVDDLVSAGVSDYIDSHSLYRI